MSAERLLLRGRLILRDRLLAAGAVLVEGSRITAVGLAEEVERLAKRSAHPPSLVKIVDAGDGYVSPGFIDMHVHGGDGADFMDGDAGSFAKVLAAHLRHGTTSITPTTTVARHEQILAVLALCRSHRMKQAAAASRATIDAGSPLRRATSPHVLGAHFYGPYFQRDARGCHPGDHVRPPRREEFEDYLSFADAIATATIAPEVEGAADFAMACRERGVRMNAGHTHATFDQMAEAVGWGVRHVDHLYCAMSDKSKLRQRGVYPMRGGVLEATLYFDELTTEVIADGKHLSADLLRLALKIKGLDRLALVTDCNRALDMPEGEYLFGPSDGGEPFSHADGVGLMPDRSALASSVRGMDHMVRTFHAMTGEPLENVVRMASLTPACILGKEADLGSIEIGKQADLLVLSCELEVERVFVGGCEAEIGEPLSMPRRMATA